MVSCDKLLECVDLVGFVESFQSHHTRVVKSLEALVSIVNKGEAPAHASTEVTARGTEYGHRTAGHILASVIANAFNDRSAPGVANSEAFTSPSGGEEKTPSGAIETGVAYNDILAPGEALAVFGPYNDFAGVHALSDVVLSFTKEAEPDPLNEKSAEALARGAGKGQVETTRGHAFVAV